MKKKLNKKLSAYSITAGAVGMVAPPSADALIVYFDVNPDVTVRTTANPYEYVNPFSQIMIYGVNLSPKSFQTFSYEPGDNTYGAPGYSNAFALTIFPDGVFLMYTSGFKGLYDSNNEIPRLSNGAVIGTNLDFKAEQNYLYDVSWAAAPGVSYLPIYLDAGGGNGHYGWIALAYESEGEGYSLTLSGFAFEQEYNQSILAGQTEGGAEPGGGGGGSSVPEPGTAVSMLFGLAALAHLRARRNNQGGAPDSLLKLAYGADAK